MKLVIRSTIAAIAALLLLGASIAFANPTAEHCNGGINAEKNEASFDDEFNETILPPNTMFCVKAGTENTGLLIADGATTLQQYLFEAGIVDGSGNKGRDVSYYMIYHRHNEGPSPSATPTDPTPEPTVSPIPVPGPDGCRDQCPTPTPTSTPTAVPSSTPSPSPSISTPTSTPTPSATTPNTTTETIYEDDPRWDCETMGNQICGPVLPDTAVPYQPTSELFNGAQWLVLIIGSALIWLLVDSQTAPTRQTSKKTRYAAEFRRKHNLTHKEW